MTGFIAAGVSGLLGILELTWFSSALSAAELEIEVAFNRVGKSPFVEAIDLSVSLRLGLMDPPFLEKVSRETFVARE